MIWRRGSFWALAGLILAALFLRFWRLGAVPLFGDEAYYLIWSDRPALAYFDHPAGIGLLIRLSTLIGGRSELGIRWLSALLSTACVPLAYAVGRRYLSPRSGWIAAAAVAFGPVYVITGRITYPDALQSFLLLLNLFILAPILVGRASLWQWGGFGLTLALLLNVKLSSGFYLAALLICLLLWQRDLLGEGGLWLAAGLAGLGLLPEAVWIATHGWLPVQWAVFQGQGFGLPVPSRWALFRHAVMYLSPPVALLSALALPSLVELVGRRTPERDRLRLLWLSAACLLLPVALSSANSPRNLGLGLLVLWPLVGYTGLNEFVVLLLVGAGLYGVGTAAALPGPTSLPRSVAVPAILADVAGWPDFAHDFQPPAENLLFAVDYSIAGQIRYYSGRPVYTSEGQYRLWGIPDFRNATVISLTFVPPELITERLRADFAQVTGPALWQYPYPGAVKTIHIWQAEDRRVPIEQVLDDLDYLALVRRAAGSSQGPEADR